MWYRLPTVQWGSINIADEDNAPITWTFPIPFRVACVYANGAAIYQVNNDFSYHIHSIDTAAVKFYPNEYGQLAAAYDMLMFAIGY